MSGSAGVYMQVKPYNTDAQIVANILASICFTVDGLLMPVEDYHTTLIYSTVGTAKEIKTNPDQIYLATICNVEQWNIHDNVVVATLDSNMLQMRHNRLRSAYDLTHGHLQYKPHMTLLSDVTLDTRLLKKLKHTLIGRTIRLYDETAATLED